LIKSAALENDCGTAADYAGAVSFYRISDTSSKAHLGEPFSIAPDRVSSNDLRLGIDRSGKQQDGNEEQEKTRHFDPITIL